MNRNLAHSPSMAIVEPVHTLGWLPGAYTSFLHLKQQQKTSDVSATAGLSGREFYTAKCRAQTEALFRSFRFRVHRLRGLD